MALIKFELTFDTENGSFSVVNTETGEIQEVEIPKTAKKATSAKKSTKKDDNPTPMIIVDENKYTLNKAAGDLLLNDGEENRLVVKYMKNGNKTVPTIMLGDGNKVTKSLTVACRGKAHEELVKYGTEFTLIPYPGKSGVYIMNGNIEVEELTGDENFSIPEDKPVETAPVAVADDDDLDLDGLLDNDDEGEVSSFDFTL